MKDTYFFRHDMNAHADIKLKALRKAHGWKGYGWWWYLVEMLRGEDGYRIRNSNLTVNALATDMECPVEEAQQFVKDLIGFGLLTEDDGFLHSERLDRDMVRVDEMREKRTQAAQRRWGGKYPVRPEQPATEPVEEPPPVLPEVKPRSVKPPVAKTWDEAAASIRTDYPKISDATWEREVKKCSNWYDDKGRKVVSYRATLRNWMDKAEKENVIEAVKKTVRPDSAPVKVVN